MREVQTYLIQSDISKRVKIGKAANPINRVVDLQTGSPERLRLVGCFPIDCEAALHSMFHNYRLHGEWFSSNDKLALLVRVLNREPMKPSGRLVMVEEIAIMLRVKTPVVRGWVESGELVGGGEDIDEHELMAFLIRRSTNPATMLNNLYDSLHPSPYLEAIAHA